MKRLTVDLEPFTLPASVIPEKVPKRSLKKFKKLKLKRIKKDHSINNEHNYVKQKLPKNDKLSPSKPSVFSFPHSSKHPAQLSVVPTNAKVNIKGLGKSKRTSAKIDRTSRLKNSGALNSSLIEHDGELFHNAVKNLIEEVQNASQPDGINIMKKLIAVMGKELISHKFMPIKEKSEEGGYTNFMQVSMDMNHMFLLMEERLQNLGKYYMIGLVVELESVFNSGIVKYLALDSLLESVLYPLYSNRKLEMDMDLELSQSQVKTKHRQDFLVQHLKTCSNNSSIVILSDEEKQDFRKVSTPISTQLNTPISNILSPLISQLTPVDTQGISLASPSDDLIQIRSEESEPGYLSAPAKKTRTTLMRGEFENYIRFLIDKYLDKYSPINCQKKESLDMVAKLATLKYPEQQHEVRKKIRNILRNTRRNNNRLMMRTLEEFGNTGTLSGPTSPPQSSMSSFKNLENQSLSHFSSFTQQPLEKYPSYSSTPENVPDINNRSSGMRFKIPYHLEVLQPPPLVSVEGDLAKQFALYNYITSQKDSEGNHLCSHFLDMHQTSTDYKKPPDINTIATNINKISWYTSLNELVKDMELMLDSAIKMHQLRSFIGRDALKLKQLITSKLRELLREEIVDLTSQNTATAEDSYTTYYSKIKKKKQLTNFYQALESYRDSNSRVLLFSFLLPPTGLKFPLEKKKFPTILEIKTSLKKNLYLGLNSFAHSILYTIYAYLSVYPPGSQAFRDSEEMAKYVQTLYKQHAGEPMLITRYAPKQYMLPDRKGYFALALPTADFLAISYQTMHQCFTTILADQAEMNALYAQGVSRSVPIAYLIPYHEVGNLIKQKLKYLNSELLENREAQSSTPTTMPKITTPSPITISTTSTRKANTITTPTEVLTTRIDTNDPPTKLKFYYFPTLQYRKYVIRHELCQYLRWSEATFGCLFHSAVMRVTKRKEKTHLSKVYKIEENYRYPTTLIEYEDIAELHTMGEKYKGNNLITHIFGQKQLPRGVKKGSKPGVDFLQFEDNKNNTYFIIRELMNKMNVNLQDMVTIMEFSVSALDAGLGLCRVGKWENIVRDVQKDPHYLESMVCLYTDRLQLALSELDTYATYGYARGKLILSKFTQIKSYPPTPDLASHNTFERLKVVPITISSEEEDVGRNSVYPETMEDQDLSDSEQFVTVPELAKHLKWNKKQVETVFANGFYITEQNGNKLLSYTYVNRVLSDIRFWDHDDKQKPPSISEEAVSPAKEPAKIWKLPSKKGGYILLEDLGKHAEVPITILEVRYQVYIYVVKSDTDRKSLSLQGFDLGSYTLIRMIECSKVKWILDMKSKKEKINFSLWTKEKKVSVPPPVPPAATAASRDIELRDFSINIAKEPVDPLKIFKYKALQMLTVDFKILTVENVKKKSIKLKVVDIENLKKQNKSIKVYTVSDRQVVILHHLAEFTQIPPSNLFLILLSYGVTYYSKNSKTVVLQRDFQLYAEELALQGVPRYKNLTIYPLNEINILLQLRQVGFYNVKLIELYNLVNSTTQKVLTIVSTAKLIRKSKHTINSKKDIYSTDFKIHTVRDPESDKTIILKIFEDHYLFKPRDQIMVYNICEGENSVNMVLLHDMAKFTNIPLTRLQNILSSYANIPSYSYTNANPETRATFKRYIKMLVAFGIPHYMKHTVLYPKEYLTSFLHLRELGFFKEKLLNVYKMIKFSPVQQKRILLTIKPTVSQETGTKRPIEEDETVKKMPDKKPKISSVSGKKLKDIPKPRITHTVTKEIAKPVVTHTVTKLKALVNKPEDIIRVPSSYKLSSRPGEWILHSELADFLDWNFEFLHSKLKPFSLEIEDELDLLEIMEQGAKLWKDKLFLTPKYIVNKAIKAKMLGIIPINFRIMFDKLHKYYTPRDHSESTIEGSDPAKVTYFFSSNLLGTIFTNHDKSSDVEESEFDSTDEFKIKTVWNKNKPIKLRLPLKYIHSSPPTPLKPVTMIKSNCIYFSAEELGDYLGMCSQELVIAFKGGCPEHLDISVLTATPDLQLFISLRLTGIPLHKIWLTYFACKNITSNGFECTKEINPDQKYVTEFFKIGPHKTKLVITNNVRKMKVLPKHICPVYSIPDYCEFYYILEEVAVEMRISIDQIFKTKDLVFYQKIIKQVGDEACESLQLPYTLVRVEDLQSLSLLHSLGLPGPVALHIFQQLRLIQDFNTRQVHDFTNICNKGYQPNKLRKWMVSKNRDGLILQSVTSSLGVSTELLEKKYKHLIKTFQRNSLEHILLQAQGFYLPDEFDHFTFLHSSNLLHKDMVYLDRLNSKQITSLLSHKPSEWPYRLCPNLITKYEHNEMEILIKTVLVNRRMVRIISKQGLTFNNVIKIHILHNPKNYEVVLLSDLERAFISSNRCEVDKLCESLRVKCWKASISETRYICIQRDDLTVNEIACMNLLTYNERLELIILLLAVGANPTQLIKVVNDINWNGFARNIDVLVTRPQEFSSWITDYLNVKANTDLKFIDLSQDYNYRIVDIVRPTLTINRKNGNNDELLPFCVWRLNSTSNNWVSVSAIKDLLSNTTPKRYNLPRERMVSPNSNEGRILACQGFVFPDDEPQAFWSIIDLRDRIISDICVHKLSKKLYEPLLEYPEEDFSITSIFVQAIYVKVVTKMKYHRKITLRRYAQYHKTQNTLRWASLDEILSYIPKESSRTAIISYFNDTKQTRVMNNKYDDSKPITFIRWTFASQLIQLLELGCDIDNYKLLELYNYIMKQTEKVLYKVSRFRSCSVWCFLQEVNDQNEVNTPDNVITQPANNELTDTDDSFHLPDIDKATSSDIPQNTTATYINDLSTELIEEGINLADDTEKIELMEVQPLEWYPEN
ncbi:hypothetical protein LOD99_2694 [Oopsacas minuta]|uniref:Nucleolar protein 4 helical domain-containing protein n=1 Tax=Oopsacas minuta TaxID=111878 RepID=A0AAV7K223_9METZ|nr:hypothetical protein LOD99_2694 [Oopsacas minuta]